ncbi:MAG TPA: hypothetical protein DHV36_14310 [Desulfobacteraceae bacterium]|nr:hypothetical protein [Desulfobacteraceae bacterium]
MQRHITHLILALVICLFGCAEQRLQSASIFDDNTWDENINQEAKDIAAPGHGGMTKDQEDGTQFFNQRKPQIKTVQIWLESGKVLSDKMKNYLDTIIPGSDKTETLSPARKLVGSWYGLDRKHEGAIVFTFDIRGRFTWKGPDRNSQGTYQIDQTVMPYRITLLAADLPDGFSTTFEFINDNALIFKGEGRDVVLFKKGKA